MPTVGRTKSGMPWKKAGERCGMNKPVAAKSFARRMEIAKQFKAMKEKEKILKASRFEARKAQAERTNAKIARRKINEVKSSSYLLVSQSSSPLILFPNIDQRPPQDTQVEQSGSQDAGQATRRNLLRKI